MATIIIRNSTGSGAIPSSLVQGELAINTIDGKLFYGSGSGNIVKEFTGSGGGGGGSTFPFTGSARITGSLNIIGGTTVTGSLTVTGSSIFNGTTLTLGTTGLLSTWQGTNHSLYFYHENSTTFRILSSLGPALDVKADSFRFVNSPLVVGANVTPLGRLHIQGTGATSATTALRVENTNASASMVVLDNGNVGVGTTSPTNTLDVNGTARIISNLTVSGSILYRVPGYGSFTLTNSWTDSTNNNSIAVYDGNGNIGLVSGTGFTRSIIMRPSPGAGVLIGPYVTGNGTGYSNILNISGSSNFIGNLIVTGSTTLHNGQTTIQGAGATSATTALIVRNSIPTNIITVLNNGVVGINRTPTASLDVAGTTRLSGSFNTSASGSILTVIGSGSTQPIFTVQGSQGELFSITDSLSGSLFSVNDISGLPILEVFSDNTTLIGDYQDPMLITTKKVTMTNSGSFVVYSLPTASYDTAFFDYSIKSGSNARAGQIMAIQNGSSVNFTETTTTDFGSTTAVSFTVLVSGSNMVLTGSAATGSWTIKTIVRGI